mgnify:CR=1 FL=1
MESRCFWALLRDRWVRRQSTAVPAVRSLDVTQTTRCNVAAQQRHADVTNDKAVFGLLFGAEVQVDEAAQAELAYVLAGVGGRPRKRWATWWEPGRRAPARPLELLLVPPLGDGTVVAAQEHGGHGVPAPESGLRVAGVLEQAVRERLVDRGVGVAHDAGEQPRDGLDHHLPRSLHRAVGAMGEPH